MRCSKDRNPWTASSPFVVPENVRMASAILASVSMAGRPSAAPPSITPPDSRQLRQLVVQPVGDVLHREAELVRQRAYRGELVGDGGVVPFDNLEAWIACPARRGTSPRFQSRTTPFGWAVSPGGVVLHRYSNQVASCP